MVYKVKPRSREQIRAFANIIRKIVEAEEELEFPIVEVFEMLSEKGFYNYEILPKNEMGNKFGETFLNEKTIHIREDIYDNACEGDAFSRATIAHEICHVLLHDTKNISLCRTKEEDRIKTYENPEWQADCFSGELLVSKRLVQNMSVDEVIKKCKVSRKMASYQLKKYREEDKKNDRWKF